MTIFDYIKAEEHDYQTVRIPITDQYEWNMHEHIERVTNMLNSIFWKGSNDDFSRPYMQIVLEPANFQKTMLDFNESNISIFTRTEAHQDISWLFNKFHHKWAREEIIGQFYNQQIEQFSDYGGVLVKKTRADGRLHLEVIPLQQIAFCDQTDIMSGPICLKHQYSPDQLKEYGAKWENVDELISLSNAWRSDDDNRQTETPGRYVDVYEVHGMLPTSFFDEENGADDEFDRFMFVVGFYKDKRDRKGILLFKGKENENPYDFEARDPIYGRALGRSAIEELFHPQIWTNWSAAQMKSILEVAGKQIFQTADQNFESTNVLTQLKSGQVIKTAPNMPLTQLNNSPANVVAFENAVSQWIERSKAISASYDATTGADSASGMPFRLGALLAQQGQSTHKKRQQILELFNRRIYQNWVLPYLGSEMNKPQVLRMTLTQDELERVVAASEQEHAKQTILNGGVVSPIQRDQVAQFLRDTIRKRGNSISTRIPKGYFKDADLDVDFTITGENSNLPLMVDKLSSVFQTIALNPAILENDMMRSLFNQILEYSGLSSFDIEQAARQPIQQQPLNPQQAAQQAAPLQQLTQAVSPQNVQ